MCCIYSICKVKENEIKFKTIVAMYKNLPHASTQVKCISFVVCLLKKFHNEEYIEVLWFLSAANNCLQVYKNALIAENRYDSIIGFYNQIFMHNLKSYILSFASPKQV